MGFLILFVPFEVFSQTHKFAFPLLYFVRTHSGYFGCSGAAFCWPILVT
jgi:hypothetical protein